MSSYVYILTNKRNGTLYIGATTNIVRRIWEHKNGFVDNFSSKYKLHKLVYFEVHETLDDAFTREKRMKAWKREWKVKLIEENNPEWDDLYSSIIN